MRPYYYFETFRFVDGTGNPCNYTFRHWLQTDIFIYFSHHFVTIPPIGWINAAHSHGVKILGTLITEWDDGMEICQVLLENEENIDRAVSCLVQIAEDFGFDGYLLNIENKLENGTTNLLKFMKMLQTRLKQANPSSLLIFYDSILKDGTLNWQNELTMENKDFFDASDGIFLNYNWNEETLSRSKNLGAERYLDIFVGVDVFGRGCFGGGGLNMYKAVDEIKKIGLSVAIFAPGWSYECHDYANFQKFDNQLWNRSINFFSYKIFKEDPNSGGKQIISTDFSCGFGLSEFFHGKDERLTKFIADTICKNYAKIASCQTHQVTTEKPWFDIGKISFQPVLIHHYLKPTPLENVPAAECALDLGVTVSNQDEIHKSEENEATIKLPEPEIKLWDGTCQSFYDTSMGFNGTGSLRVGFQLDTLNQPSLKFLFVPIDIELRKDETVVVTIVGKVHRSDGYQPTFPLRSVLVIETEVNQRKLILEPDPVNLIFQELSESLEWKVDLQKIHNVGTFINGWEILRYRISCSDFYTTDDYENLKLFGIHMICSRISILEKFYNPSKEFQFHLGYFGIAKT